MFRLLKEIYRRRELLLILVARNLKIRYKNSALGFFWTLLVPLFLILIYSTFLRILRFASDDPLFLPRLVTGIIVWQFVALCLNDSLQAILGNANLVTKSAFPRIILPLAMIVANLVNFVLSSVVLVVYLVVAGADFGNFAVLPFIVLTQCALCLGLSLILSALNVFFRDTEHILGVALMAWFFLTPVIYPFELIPERFQALASLNPMVGIVSAYRGVFLSANPMTPDMLRVSFCIAWIVVLVGFVFFQKMQVRFGDEL